MRTPFDDEHCTVVLQMEGGRWRCFHKPQSVFCTNDISDVLDVLKEVEQCTSRGLWAAGFVSYEAAPSFDPALVTCAPKPLPLVWFGVYDSVEHLATLPECREEYSTSEWRPSLTEEEYRQRFEHIKDYIARGETYQVNFTWRLRTEFHGSPWSLFSSLVRAQSPRYAAYVNTGDDVLCSASPELFFRLKGTEITARPMKGTAPRGLTCEQDRLLMEHLQQSEKDRAENVMIVDMVRNDLSRIATRGSVRVPELFTVERYYTLLQLTSTVAASTHASLGEIFAALFPCASITGAPKIRTMQIIRELEGIPRGIYTGSVGYVSPRREMQFNVAIRTVHIDCAEGLAEYGTGGGIVWDSQSRSEYKECQLKAAVLTARRPVFSLLETLLWKPQSGYFLLERHLDRLLSSADYFGFPANRNRIVDCLEETASRLEAMPQKVRLLVSEDGSPCVEAEPIRARSGSRIWRVALASTPLDSGDRFLYHKTTERGVYDRARQERPECEDMILWNERNEVTESTLANVVVQCKRKLYTPPVSCGLLNGTYRAHLLSLGSIRERVIMTTDLYSAERLFLINSVRGWIPAQLVGQSTDYVQIPSAGVNPPPGSTPTSE